MPTNSDHRITKRAFEIWEQEGRPDGRSQEHWNKAKAEIEEQQEASAELDAEFKDGSQSDPVEWATTVRPAD